MEIKELAQAFNDQTEAVVSLLSKYEWSETERIETARHMEKLRADLSGTQDRLSGTATALDTAIGSLPTQIEVRLRHRFEGRTRIYGLIFLLGMIIMALTTGAWIASRRENAQLRESDLKYRYHRLTIPDAALHADTLYQHNPDGFHKMVLLMEAQRQALQRAETNARQKEAEALKAREKLEDLKRKAP
ncbi:hypothetical protein G5B35_18845 [Parapusillimonas sp. SGNA-6]|uniref:hypothetical protein n=1 Tax=Parapedobacter sp. SGR-10 TaxID=2710879 RepID=UPI0013D4F8EC|nr:hypothetical protein [Parapedobacter sp. SGR-10]NGF54888.1 hypothetical protein [Parapedobacter sp. SGR-10]NGM89355.1 hypothetical protein [Parapusillimonas sp. SGNA-6]